MEVLIAFKVDDQDNLIRISGSDNILASLEENWTGKSATSESRNKVAGIVALAGSHVEGWLRNGRGVKVSSCAQSQGKVNQPLILDSNQFCRLVREVLTELDIVYELRSTGKGSVRRFDEQNLIPFQGVISVLFPLRCKFWSINGRIQGHHAVSLQTICLMDSSTGNPTMGIGECVATVETCLRVTCRTASRIFEQYQGCHPRDQYRNNLQRCCGGVLVRAFVFLHRG
jgi:hypothetical protein